MNIWKASLSLAKAIYEVTAKGDFSRDFGLRDQIRRAAVSVNSNIVEGFEKNNNNEFARFLRIAKGSAGEVRSQLHIARAVGYITQKEFSALAVDFEALSAQIGKFIAYLEQNRRDNKKSTKMNSSAR
ncbi:MAG TPA: four helix bundle protein [Candidatus Moranbacteria bacterium]|nr:four helix bundle protein [Candidatus Moranbacteria bacterium]